MKRFKFGVAGLIGFAMVLCVGLLTLVGCIKNYSVTFSIEGKTTTVETVDGKVTNMPDDPSKEYYDFRGWYTTETFEDGTEFTADTVVHDDMTVYAYFAPIYVDIVVNNEEAINIKLEDLKSKTDSYSALALKEDLTFDGWYVDSQYTTKYSEQSVDNLYARYVATVQFDNGYEILKEVKVGINSTMRAPDKEYSDFIPYYMDSEDLSYVDEDGNAVDFDNMVITTNKTITVLWKSPYLKYKKIEGTTNDYAVIGFDYGNSNTSEQYLNIKRFPAISFLSKNVTIDGVKGCNVVAADFALSSTSTVEPSYCSSCIYASFAEGIQYINEFKQCVKLEEVKLPSTLKVLEDSFWNTKNLKSLVLPEGLEVIIDSLWADFNDGLIGSYRNECGFAFEVVIPSSVKTLITVPSNLKFEDGSEYYYEDGALYRNRRIGDSTYKTLICQYQVNASNDTITVNEGVEAVSVGAFVGMDIQYISLPSTFKAISYISDINNETYEFSFYTGSLLTDMTRVSAPDSKSNSSSYSVYTGLLKEDFQYVYIKTTSMPDGISEYAFTGNATPYTELVDSNGISLEKVVFIGEIADGNEVLIHIVGEDYRDITTKANYSISGKLAGQSITASEILAAIGIKEDDYRYVITELGSEYTPDVLDHNLYLFVSYTNYVLGVSYTVDDVNQIITVTGFDTETAKDLGGVYRINIDFSTESSLASYKVVIADGAFKDNNYISEVYLSNAVTVIGEEAFMNMSNLSKVIVADGGLEVIKRNAFANAGCIMDNDNNITVNSDISKNGITMQIPLANITSIEPYAFKSKAIYTFSSTALEAERVLDSTASAGEYFYVQDAFGDTYGIIKYVTNENTQIMKDNEGNDVSITIYDVQYIATAGGFQNGSGHLGIGYSYRKYGYDFGKYVSIFVEKQTYVFRYEVMEGSIYYLGSAFNYISFGIFTYIHKNAFTDMEETKYAIYNNVSYDIWMDEEQVKSQDSSLFEEGWFEGRANSENTFMTELQDHEDSYL